MDLRLRRNEASRPVARKPSGRQVFCLWASLARPLQPAAGMMRGPRRLAHSQNPSPQHPSQFSVRLYGTLPLVGVAVRKLDMPLPRGMNNFRQLG